ncbi:MAG: hypothetical protein ACYTGP_06740 [Planctomycetota bacterium]|jgi:hypothetical protein
MMSLRQIEQLIERKSYRRLLDRLLDNGRCVRQHVRRRLHEPPYLVGTALGLALQRVCELSYGPSEIGARLAEEVRLRLGMAVEALTSANASPDALASAAVALRGLRDWLGDWGDTEVRALKVVRGFMDRADVARRDPVAVEIARWQLNAMLPAASTERTAA